MFFFRHGEIVRSTIGRHYSRFRGPTIKVLISHQFLFSSYSLFLFLLCVSSRSFSL